MVTIREIAKAVGVSSGTVSRVLNYDPTLSVSPQKRQAIIETAEALNYSTPRNRRADVSPRLSSRAAVVPRLAIVHFLEPSEELIDPYYIGVRLGIENRCRDLKAEVVKVFHSEAAAEAGLLQTMSGVIAIGKHAVDEVEWLVRCSRHLVFADFVPRDPHLDCVSSDLAAATRTILDGLQARGYRRIAFIGAHDPINGDGKPFGERRCRAYVDWQRERGSFDEGLIALGDHNTHGQNLRLEVGYEQARHILALDPCPDAILAANDNMAIGAYRAIAEAGLAVPKDIAVVSYNDIPVAQFLSPPLSTMRIPSEPIGETAVDLLAERINGRSYAKRVMIPTEMIWRDSCRGLPEQAAEQV